MGKPCKADLQGLIDEQQRQIEQGRLCAEADRQQIEQLRNTVEEHKRAAQLKERRISMVSDDLADQRKETEKYKKQAADYKRELDGLADTKAVLDRLLNIFQNPHNEFQKIVNELNDIVRQERSKANALEQDLRNIQFDIQHNKFLEGKVQAYEAIFRVNPVKAQQNSEMGKCGISCSMCGFEWVGFKDVKTAINACEDNGWEHINGQWTCSKCVSKIAKNKLMREIT